MFENPTTVTIGGQEYPIRTDFRTWIKFETLLQDERVHDRYRIPHVINLLFNEPPQASIAETFSAIIWFFSLGEKTKNNNGAKRDVIVYDYGIDYGRTKAAFIKEFGFNPFALPYYHFWDYQPCFRHLLGDTLKNAVEWRTVDITEYKGAQRAKMIEGRNRHKIPSRQDIKMKHETKKAEIAYRSGNLTQYILEYRERVNNGKI